MVRPCVGIPRFRGVFRLTHTPHISPLPSPFKGWKSMRTTRTGPERLTPREATSSPPEEGGGVPPPSPAAATADPPSLPSNHGVMDSARLSSGPRNVYHLTGHSSSTADFTITSN